jgi:KDO2-lipid IV(A) lauroyltransferase
VTTYYVLRIGAAVSRVVPLALLYALASLAARVGYLLPTPARAAVRGNIARAMGRPANNAAVRRAAREAFRCQALNYVDLMRLDRVTPRELDASVVRGDLTPFVDVVAQGRGVIIVSAHVGNMDYVAQWLGLQGYRVHAAMERLQPECLYQLVKRQRESAGLRIHPVAAETVGTLTEALRRGEVVALIADRDINDSGIPVDFFGAPARLPAGPALLALRTGAPIIAAFGGRLRDDRLYVSARPPVYLTRTRNLRGDLHQGVQTVARLLEEGIRRAPAQWIVFEPIWKEGTACA